MNSALAERNIYDSLDRLQRLNPGGTEAAVQFKGGKPCFLPENRANGPTVGGNGTAVDANHSTVAGNRVAVGTPGAAVGSDDESVGIFRSAVAANRRTVATDGACVGSNGGAVANPPAIAPGSAKPGTHLKLPEIAPK